VPLRFRIFRGCQQSVVKVDRERKREIFRQIKAPNRRNTLEYFKVWQRGALRKRSAFDAEGLSPRAG